MNVNPSLLLYVVIGLGVVVVINLIWMYRIQSRLKRMLLGKDAKTLEDSIVTIMNELKDLKKFTVDMETYLTTVETRVKKSIQSVETIRFNPFKGTGSGGNQSFSTSFINEHGDGVVLTGMYARDRISIFSKPLKTFKSEFDLSEEETEAIDKSKKKLTP